MNKKYIIIGIAIIILLFFFLVIVPKKPKTEPPIVQPPTTPSEEVAEEKPEEIVIVEDTPKTDQLPSTELPSTGFETIEGPYEKIKVISDAPRNGIYDPSVEYGPDGTGWLVYSAIFGGRVPFGPYVETHLAKSVDNGATWQYVKTINKAFDDSFTTPEGKTISGNWNYEVSSIVYDQNDAGKEWKLFSHRLFAPDDTGHNNPEYSWIVYRYAPHPEGPWSNEIALFRGSQTPLAPFSDDVKIKLSELHRDLRNYAIYSEPGTVAVGNTLYLSLAAIAITGKPQAIILLASDDHGDTWRYVGTLADRDDASKLGYDGFDGSSLTTVNGKQYLLVAPKKEGVGEYIGTFVIEIENIASAKLKRSGDVVVPQSYIKPDDSIYFGNAGESDYDEENTAGGVVMAQLNVDGAPEIFQIFNTEYNLP